MLLSSSVARPNGPAGRTSHSSSSGNSIQHYGNVFLTCTSLLFVLLVRRKQQWCCKRKSFVLKEKPAKAVPFLCAKNYQLQDDLILTAVVFALLNHSSVFFANYHKKNKLEKLFGIGSSVF